jgi:hypothetical protein
MVSFSSSRKALDPNVGGQSSFVTNYVANCGEFIRSVRIANGGNPKFSVPNLNISKRWLCISNARTPCTAAYGCAASQ